MRPAAAPRRRHATTSMETQRSERRRCRGVMLSSVSEGAESPPAPPPPPPDPACARATLPSAWVAAASAGGTNRECSSTRYRSGSAMADAMALASSTRNSTAIASSCTRRRSMRSRHRYSTCSTKVSEREGSLLLLPLTFPAAVERVAAALVRFCLWRGCSFTSRNTSASSAGGRHGLVAHPPDPAAEVEADGKPETSPAR